MRILLRKLAAALEEDIELWGDHCPALLWVAFIGLAGSAPECTEQNRFMRIFTAVADLAIEGGAVRQQGDVQKILSNFLGEDELCRPILESACHSMKVAKAREKTRGQH